MLNQLFPSFYGNSSNGGTNLSSGGTPETLQGNDKESLAKYSSIPNQVTQAEVDKVAREAGNIEGDTVLMKIWSEQALNAQSAALANLDVRISHAQQSMKNEQQYRKKIAKHGKNALEHRLDVSATKNNIDGFQQALSNVTDTIHI